MQSNYDEVTLRVLSPAELTEAISGLNYIHRTRGPEGRPSLNSTMRVVLETMVKRTKLPENFQMRVEVPLDRTIPPFVYITATWRDIYEPRQVAMTYGKIEGLELYAGLNEEAWIRLWKAKVEDIISLLWNHELHELLMFDGVHIRDPHPQGRDGPLG